MAGLRSAPAETSRGTQVPYAKAYLPCSHMPAAYGKKVGGRHLQQRQNTKYVGINLTKDAWDGALRYKTHQRKIQRASERVGVLYPPHTGLQIQCDSRQNPGRTFR